MSDARAKAAAASRMAIPNSKLVGTSKERERFASEDSGPRVEFSDLHFDVSEAEEAAIQESVRKALAKTSQAKR